MAPPPLPAQISGPPLHMLVLALFGIPTCSLACNSRPAFVGSLMLSSTMIKEHSVTRRPAGRPVHHLHVSDRRPHIFDTLLRTSLFTCLDLWHRCFGNHFIGIIIPYGSRNNRALLVYLHSIEHFILPKPLFLPFQTRDTSWTSFLM